MKERIWLSLAEMGGTEQKYIQEAFDTNWVVPLGPNVNAFETDLVRYLQAEKSVVALSAGTAALHLALVMLGVERDDEVICQSFTFSASANPITYQGAKPVFVDSEPDTWNMSPHYLRLAIKDRVAQTGRKPKAIIPVHLYGMPAKMDEILAIAEEYDIPVLEDAAEAIGSEYKGRKCGTLGTYGALSFNGNKMITTSGGGALICPSSETAQRVTFFATQAREQAPHYQHEYIGYNYRLSNVCAGIGRGQMEVLDAHIARRREIHALYTEALKEIPAISVLQNPSNDFNSNFWLTCILIDPQKTNIDREQLRLHLEQDNIESRPLWKPMHLQPVFASCPYYGATVAKDLFDKGLCLPSGSSLTNADIARVVVSIKTCFSENM
ncbi:MAG: aminotransferase class I/II-fold pyridoxal phosphate-dependent enzyme [Bacteroidales bacterium]|nr:aminotransferase class I/II-fold pyridoxal phosphate-dependent enzyme [Porphyromonas sp.]MDD6935228.1 aminotransferase class I/II-fold pyridoxal phosphate-dependent enzyme [Bacteroidales bacterium]MDY3101881.1 aminotransferase class I/II-fold pyridoxal phosphate-dependent enzyme [Porphyromonas sp.]